MSTEDRITFSLSDNNSNASDNTLLDTVEKEQQILAELQVKIKEYVKANNVLVNILTPAYGGMNHVSYTHAIVNTVNVFNAWGIPLKIDFCRNESLVCRARNNLVAKAMTDPKVSHVLFIDSDIAWSPIDIIVLLLADKDIIGGAYPIKSYLWSKLLEEGGQMVKKWIEEKNKSKFRDVISDEELIKQKLLRYNMNLWKSEMRIEDNILEVRHTATGFMLIKRSVIEQMQKKYEHTKYKDNTDFLTEKEMENAYALFETSIVEGFYMSEDWTFCERWTKEMGGKVFINVGIYLSHTGTEEYKGSLLGLLL